MARGFNIPGLVPNSYAARGPRIHALGSGVSAPPQRFGARTIAGGIWRARGTRVHRQLAPSLRQRSARIARIRANRNPRARNYRN